MAEDFHIETLTIGKVKIPVKIMDLDQAILQFYPENPRVYSALNSNGTVPSQEEIEEHMKKRDHVKALKEDIKDNGGLMERIIVRDGDFVVLEGNSRLAAYRMLCEIDAVTWAKIPCQVLPSDIKEDLIFKLIGQFHIKGKKPWEAYEQANYLFRRVTSTNLHIETIAEELGIDKAQARYMVEAVKLMNQENVTDTHKYSYYFEYVKDAALRKYRETHADMDKVVSDQIKKGEIENAEDIRKLAKVAKVNDKQSKKLMQSFIAGEVSVYDAYDDMDSQGKLESSVTKLKTFRKYINTDTFEKNVRQSPETYKNAKYEIDQIVKRLNQLSKKWDAK